MRKHQPNLKIHNFMKNKETLRNERYIFIHFAAYQLLLLLFVFVLFFFISFLCKEVNGSPTTKKRFGLGKKHVDYIKLLFAHIYYICSLEPICCSLTQLCLTLCDPMDYSMPGIPILHHFSELVQTEVHWISDAIQQSHALSSPFPPAFSLSQHQGLF